jgi:hypothetical protein
MTGNKHIVVCGDSFCSTKINCNERHFSEILKQDYGYQVTNLAKAGCTQTMIGFQVKAAIEVCDADIIVHNKTFPDRIDFPIRSPVERYNSYTLESFVYDDDQEQSYYDVGKYFSPPTGSIKSTNMHSLDAVVSPDLKDTITTYLLEAQDYYLQEHIVEWIHDYWDIRAKAAGKQTIQLLKHNGIGKLLYGFCDKGRVNYPTPFHTDEATQQKVAELIDMKIRNRI